MHLFFILFLVSMVGCVKNTNNFAVQSDVYRSGNEFYRKGYEPSGPLLRVVNLNFLGETKVGYDNAYVFGGEGKVVSIYDSFGYTPQRIDIDYMPNSWADTNGGQVIKVDSGRHEPNGQYLVAVKKSNDGEFIVYKRIHAEQSYAGWYYFDYDYIEPLGMQHRFQYWPDNVPQKAGYIKAFIQRARDAVLVMP
jgi:hypothetical protein